MRIFIYFIPKQWQRKMLGVQKATWNVKDREKEKLVKAVQQWWMTIIFLQIWAEQNLSVPTSDESNGHQPARVSHIFLKIISFVTFHLFVENFLMSTLTRNTSGKIFSQIYFKSSFSLPLFVNISQNQIVL